MGDKAGAALCPWRQSATQCQQRTDVQEREKKKAAREEDARPDLEYGDWEEECRIPGIEFWEEEVNSMTNTYPAASLTTTAINAYQLCKYAAARKTRRPISPENPGKP